MSGQLQAVVIFHTYGRNLLFSFYSEVSMLLVRISRVVCIIHILHCHFHYQSHKLCLFNFISMPCRQLLPARRIMHLNSCRLIEEFI